MIKKTKFNKKKIFTLDQKLIKNIFKKKINRYRICLHENEKSSTQSSLIFTKGFNYFRVHKHPKNVSESYTVIKGKLNVYLLDDNENVIKKIFLEEIGKKSKLPCFYNLSKSNFHLVLPITNETIYYEVTNSKFSNKNFIKFLKSSPDYKSSLTKQIDFVSKISGINIYKQFKIEK